jgi:hypothetical protein
MVLKLITILNTKVHTLQGVLKFTDTRSEKIECRTDSDSISAKSDAPVCKTEQSSFFRHNRIEKTKS